MSVEAPVLSALRGLASGFKASAVPNALRKKIL
jgi:hypothetical protein